MINGKTGRLVREVVIFSGNFNENRRLEYWFLQVATYKDTRGHGHLRLSQDETVSQ